MSPPHGWIIGCGDLGQRVGRLLADAGTEVFGARRNPDEISEPLNGVALDVAERASWKTLTQRAPRPDTVVYAVAAGESSEAAYRRAYVTGVRHLCATLATLTTQPRRVVFVSSTSVYGQDDGEWIDEDSATEPTSYRGAIVREGEELLAAAAIPSVLVRLSGIYGPGRTRLIDRARRAAPSERSPWSNRIHVDDAATAIVHLLAQATVDPIYIGVDDEPARLSDVVEFIRAQSDPAQLGSEDSSSSSSRTDGEGKRCRNRRLRDTGWRPQYPTYREGYASLLT